MFYASMVDSKPALSISDIFLNSLREKYSIETYTPAPNSLIISVHVEVGSSPITLIISDLERFRKALVFYINSLNHYYLFESKKVLDKSFEEIFRNLIVGLGKEESMDFVGYIENITNKINSISTIIEESKKKM